MSHCNRCLLSVRSLELPTWLCSGPLFHQGLSSVSRPISPEVFSDQLVDQLATRSGSPLMTGVLSSLPHAISPTEHHSVLVACSSVQMVRRSARLVQSRHQAGPISSDADPCCFGLTSSAQGYV